MVMRRSILFLLLAGVAPGCFASMLYLDALPNINLNDSAGSFRSNIAFGESDPTAAFDGTAVTFNSPVLIDTVSNWSIASAYGEALGNEFSSVTLYFRPVGGTWQVLSTGSPDTSFDVPLHPFEVGDSNPNMLSTQVAFFAPVLPKNSYEGDGTPGVFYPIWQNDFGNLNLVLPAGTYEFAVNGTGSAPDPNSGYGYWYNSFVNGLLSGSLQSDMSGTYLRCSYADMSGPCFVEDPTLDGTWDKGANFNLAVEGTALPEPGSALMVGIGFPLLCGFLAFRQRQAA